MTVTERYTQSHKELEEHLLEQVLALKASTAAFDEGNDFEGKRLAVAIRVLVHDTSSSHSLLGQMGLKVSNFYDTALEIFPDNPITQSAITGVLTTPEGSEPLALLDDFPPPGPKWVSFEDWWNGVILVDKEKRRITRKDLVLFVTNTDGGAHIDETLAQVYADLSRHNSLNWKSYSRTGVSDLRGPELAALRQIAHEVLRTLEPGMPHSKPKLPERAAVSIGARVTIDETPARHPAVHKVGRNAPCPCGSGKKYKRCALAQR